MAPSFRREAVRETAKGSVRCHGDSRRRIPAGGALTESGEVDDDHDSARRRNSWRDLPLVVGYVRLTSYTFGAFTLDLERFRLERAGQPCTSSGRCSTCSPTSSPTATGSCAKTELLDNVWGDRFVSESALSSRIKAARRAVDDDGARQAGDPHGLRPRLPVRRRRQRRADAAGTDGRRHAGAAADRAGDRVLRRARRDAHRLQRRRRGPATRQGGELDDPPRLRPREPGVAPLDRGHRRPIGRCCATTSEGVGCPTGTSTVSTSRPGSRTSRQWSTAPGSTASRSSACPRARPWPSPSPCAIPNG